jgi:N utilization substance protein B
MLEAQPKKIGRRKCREMILQLLYAYEIRENDSEKILEDFFQNNSLEGKAKEFVTKLYLKVVSEKEKLDERIKPVLKNWDIRRIAVVDKNIIRLSLAEILYFPEVPLKVSIDEAVELAKKYGTKDSSKFVNGVLDAMAKELFNKKVV